MADYTTFEEKEADEKAHAVAALKEVVRVLNYEGSASADLWAILTALRGPDNEDDQLKKRTTTNIRGAIGLDGSPGRFRSAVVTHGPVKYQNPSMTENKVAGCAHFAAHINSALWALERFKIIEISSTSEIT